MQNYLDRFKLLECTCPVDDSVIGPSVCGYYTGNLGLPCSTVLYMYGFSDLMPHLSEVSLHAAHMLKPESQLFVQFISS